MKSDGYSKYVCDKCGKATRIAEDVTPDIYELCSKCNSSFMTFMQENDESFEAWLKEVEQ